MGKKITPTGVSGMLMRLRKDQGGNTIAIVGAALIPLTAMVGGGVDASRAYMVKARLQQACDAGVLAGRKAVGEGTFDTNAQDRADAFFKNNFPDGYQSTTETNFTVGSDGGSTTVTGTATTTLPTVIMGLFAEDEDDSYETQKSKKRIQDRAEARTGVKNSLMTKQSIQLTVSCNAKLEVSNSDVMMVLDTTGSMACPQNTNDTGCNTYLDTYGTVEGANGSTSRMAALKSAMVDFNKILDEAATGTTARVRYGFVPFSSTVNVGKLIYERDSDFLLGGSSGDKVQYQSRRPVYKIYGTTVTSTITETMDFVRSGITYAAYSTSSECTKYQNNQNASIRYFRSGSWRTDTWTPANDGYSGTGNPLESGSSLYTFTASSWATPNGESTTYKTCKRTRKTTGITYTYDSKESGAIFSHYLYEPVSLDVSDYVETGINGGTVKNPSNNALNNPGQVTWAGCIQERKTTPNATFAYNSASESITPSGATDLDIDSEPNNDDTKWSPLWPDVTYYRENSSGAADNTSPWTLYGEKSSTACPAEAQLLSEMSRTEFATYANTLSPQGSTYHDIGAIWGARMLSPDGIFSDNVLEEPENQSYVGRHMIFLTDGQLSVGNKGTSAYGVEFHDKRITNGSLSEQNARHTSRFAAMCEAIKGKGIRIWVISFGTDLSTTLSKCASSSESVYTAANKDGLTKAFVSIAESVADLRLSQ